MNEQEPIETLETVHNDEPTTQPVTDKKSPPKSKKRLIIILAIALVLLIAGGITAYILLKPAPKDTASTPDTTTPTETPKEAAKLTARVLVEATKPGLAGELKETIQSDANSEPYKTYSAPVYEVTGYDFSVNASVDYGYTSYGTKDAIASDLSKIQTVVKDKGLKETVLDPGSAEGMYAASYESADIICIVTDQKPYQPAPGNKEFQTTLGCADKTAYEANAVALKPYFVIYAAQSPYDTTQTAMGGLSVKDSKTAGYKTAQIGIGGSEYGSVGGFAGLFYQTPDKVWHYFTGTQSQIPCTTYNTTDLKKAYLGESCYEEANEAAVVTL